MSAQQLTYESVLELIRENSREMRENSREMREEHREFRRSLKEQGAEFDRRMEEQRAEYAREKKERDAEYDRMRKELNRKIGALGNRIGEIVENMVGERIIEKFQALGYNVTHPVVRNCSFSSTKLGLYGEFDLTLVDSDIIILIEVKTTLETSHVRKHLKKIEEYRNHIAAEGFVQPHVRHLLPNTRFIGAVAGAVVEDEARQFALENGLYVIVQSGEAVEIVKTPEGFKAKEW